MTHELGVILTLLAIYAAAAVSPGPSFAVVVRLAASSPRPAAFGATLGLALGAATYATLAMTGFALAATRVAGFVHAVQIVGGCYLLFLGLTAWLVRPDCRHPATPKAPARSFACGLRTGLLVELSNPKSIVFFVSIFAIALPAETPVWAKAVILLGGVAVDLVWYGVAATLLSTGPVQRLYGRSAAWIERGLGSVLAAFGIGMLSGSL